MSWLVNVYADVPNLVVSKPLIEASPLFTDWESVGGAERRITLQIDDAEDADSACQQAKDEIERVLGENLGSVKDAAATALDT
ncbi:hypothetical protein [Mycolicibacterium fluoranthenivorans]|uniref:Uncharacterized protein n=1 Tax=Mycolicibacterium fluoranthenivorans TaxID=258505 RepID=A0A7X5ZEB9_9MYCO|nr:hypothetical protein [Mycolicibacterium fluoranthenivorans]MCV7359544.1 hypothetical protein [Mycolicibacterium fluoranthenivorans]NIH96928.1 hypothetical protein [Mycolicibacterium fluoranthenivorans]